MEQINICKELANYALEDGQMTRPFHNFFNELYDEIKGKDFNFEGQAFTDRIEFLEHIAAVAAGAARMAKAWKDDEPEEYSSAN